MQNISSQNNAFSLVELSIVLVILGLLTGGILAGQSLIRAAELRSVTTEFQRHTAAIMTFRDKYFALPGDMTNATKFWSASANCPGSSSQGTTDGSTCDGNGDGIITFNTEIFRFWQHLANAGLIEGSYNGVTGPDNIYWDSILGTNVPPSKISNAGWSVVPIVYDEGFGQIPAIAGNLSANYINNHTNQLWFGTKEPNLWTGDPALTPTEAWGIDKKMDDGKPDTGFMVASEVNTCTTDNSNVINADSEYELDNNLIACALIFLPKGSGL